MENGSESAKTYPVEHHGEIRRVTVPGAVDKDPGPDNEADLETFLCEAIESYAEASDVDRPRIRTFEEAGVLTRNRGLVVGFGDSEYQVSIVRSR